MTRQKSSAAPTMRADTESAVQRLRDFARQLDAAVTFDFPRVLQELDRARQGTPEALHVEAATFAARAKKAEDEAARLRAELKTARETIQARETRISVLVSMLQLAEAGAAKVAP